MEIKIFKSATEAAQFAAGKIADQIAARPNSVLGVATGRTMDAVYHHLARKQKEERFDCSRAGAFALDEYVGLASDDVNSYKRYLDFHLYDPLGFDRSLTHIPNTRHPDLDLAGFEYEKKIKRAGGIDLQILGIGVNGHIGLNEPGSAHDSRTRVVALSQKTRDSNSSLFKDREVPLTAMTMGIGTILDAKRIVLVATGATKAEIVQKTVNGDVNSHIPATALKNHKNALIVLDKEAAALLG